MKKLVVFLLLLLWPAMAARGESWAVDTPYNPIYYVETFGDVLPERAEAALAGETTYFYADKPARLDLLGADGFPCDLEKLAMGAEAWERIEANLETYYAQGANLREKPTGKSRSLGVYRGAFAEKLDAAPGTQHPWYKLRIGDTVGWMSGAYVKHGGNLMPPPAVAQCDAATDLYLFLGGKVKQTLPAGTAMHIIADCDGWYHVVLPREDIAWKLDELGTYGYVRMADVTEYTTLLNMKYGVNGITY